MPITEEQHKSIFEKLMSWDDLNEDAQKKVSNDVKQEFLDMLADSDPNDLPPEYVKPALAATQQVDTANVPWFYLDILLKTTMDSGETVEQHIDKKVANYCKNSVYYHAKQFAFGIEPV